MIKVDLIGYAVVLVVCSPDRQYCIGLTLLIHNQVNTESSITNKDHISIIVWWASPFMQGGAVPPD